LNHLRFHLFISHLRKTGDGNITAALNDRLTLAKDGEIAVETISDSKLLGGTYDVNMLAVPDKDA